MGSRKKGDGANSPLVHVIGIRIQNEIALADACCRNPYFRHELLVPIKSRIPNIPHYTCRCRYIGAHNPLESGQSLVPLLINSDKWSLGGQLKSEPTAFVAAAI
jgi:hypothetical protein